MASGESRRRPIAKCRAALGGHRLLRPRLDASKPSRASRAAASIEQPNQRQIVWHSSLIAANAVAEQSAAPECNRGEAEACPERDRLAPTLAAEDRILRGKALPAREYRLIGALAVSARLNRMVRPCCDRRGIRKMNGVAIRAPAEATRRPAWK